MGIVLNAVSLCLIAGVLGASVETILSISLHDHLANGTPYLAALAAQGAFNRWTVAAGVGGGVLGMVVWVFRFAKRMGRKASPRETDSRATGSPGAGRARHASSRDSMTVRVARLAILALVPAGVLTLNHAVARLDAKPMGDRPNVVFVVCETLRADHVGCYGYERDTTPNLDAFARVATRFTQAYTTAPATRPGMTNIMTGGYFTDFPLPRSLVTLAEYFKTLRYSTGAFISQQFFDDKGCRADQGFDRYDAYCRRDAHDLSKRIAHSVTNAAIGWIKLRPLEKPFFAWAVYFDPHDPYAAPKGYNGYYNTEPSEFTADRRSIDVHGQFPLGVTTTAEYKDFLIRAYDEEIRYFDSQVGRLFDYLKKAELFDDAFIVVTSDHGEELGDNGGRWDHCQLLSQEEIHVPLLVKMPRQTQGATTDAAVQNIDVFPALVDYLGARGRGADESDSLDRSVGSDRSNVLAFREYLEGESLLPLLTAVRSAAPAAAEEHAALSFCGEQEAVIQTPFKYWSRNGTETVTNVETGEEVASSSVRSRLRKTLDEKIETYGLKSEDRIATIENLKTIGYLK